MDTELLIKKITPLYNTYKQETDLTPLESLAIMWQIGEQVYDFLSINTEIKPHALFRKIYGKSEASKDISQKSYITREFMGRCLRVFNIFPSIKEINETLPNLQNLSAFRESMPFFDNPKYKLTGNERLMLLSLLNSKKKPSLIMNEIKKMQKKHIGISNPRNQHLKDYDIEKKAFIDFYNYIYRLTKNEQIETYKHLNEIGVSQKTIEIIANNTAALSQDGLKFNYIELPEKIRDKLWIDYIECINKFLAQSNAVEIRRFRRIIPPERFVMLSDMLHGLKKNLIEK